MGIRQGVEASGAGAHASRAMAAAASATCMMAVRPDPKTGTTAARRGLEDRQRFMVPGSIDHGRTDDHEAIGSVAKNRARSLFARTLAGGVIGELRFARPEGRDRDETSRGRVKSHGFGDGARALSIDAQERCRVARLDETGGMHDRIGAGGKPFACGHIFEVARHDVEVMPRQSSCTGSRRARMRIRAPSRASATTRCRPRKPVAPVTATTRSPVIRFRPPAGTGAKPRGKPPARYIARARLRLELAR